MEASERKAQALNSSGGTGSALDEVWENLKAIYIAIGLFIAWGVAIITFIGSWIYCISEYGYLLGVGLGWLPSIIVAPIAGWIAFYLWAFMPFIALIGLIIWYGGQ